MWDYDDIDHWGPVLWSKIEPLLSANVQEVLTENTPEFVEDACKILLNHLQVPCVTLNSFLVDWIAEQTVAAYHGTRLTESEVVNVRRGGLRRLAAIDREPRLRRALSRHPRWHNIEEQLATAIYCAGSGDCYGDREGQVHATISRAGLKDFDLYLTHGSEFDRCVAENLLGEDGLNMLAADGDPYIIKIAVPGRVALQANNPFGFAYENFQDMIKHMLQACVFKKIHPEWQCSGMNIDSGLIFYTDIPVEWIIDITNI